MRRTLGVATILCMLFTPVAFAGRGGRHGGGGHGGGGGRVVVRDHRAGGGGGGGGVIVRDHRSGPRVQRVRVTNGRYVFPGGVVRVYKRPHYRRYYDVHVRPPLIVETYDPVPGYIWVSGGWTWGGSEWVWTPGYWSVADEGPPEATMSGGVSVSAGVVIH
ncbi:MAG TPA: YXWGXW repeat-containing protein [Kofleriaceae bacterium]